MLALLNSCVLFAFSHLPVPLHCSGTVELAHEVLLGLCLTNAYQFIRRHTFFPLARSDCTIKIPFSKLMRSCCCRGHGGQEGNAQYCRELYDACFSLSCCCICSPGACHRGISSLTTHPPLIYFSCRLRKRSSQSVRVLMNASTVQLSDLPHSLL